MEYRGKRTLVLKSRKCELENSAVRPETRVCCTSISFRSVRAVIWVRGWGLGLRLGLDIASSLGLDIESVSTRVRLPNIEDVCEFSRRAQCTRLWRTELSSKSRSFVRQESKSSLVRRVTMSNNAPSQVARKLVASRAIQENETPFTNNIQQYNRDPQNHDFNRLEVLKYLVGVTNLADIQGGLEEAMETNSKHVIMLIEVLANAIKTDHVTTKCLKSSLDDVNVFSALKSVPDLSKGGWYTGN
eukprot:sb/3468950/